MKSIVSKYSSGNQDRFDDLYQAGLVGLLKAIRSWLPDKHTKLPTYAYNLIRWQVLNDIRAYNTKKNEVLNNACNIHSNMVAKSENWDFLDGFNSIQRDIITAHYIYGIPITTHALDLDLTRAQYRALLRDIKKRLIDVYQET